MIPIPLVRVNYFIPICEQLTEPLGWFELDQSGFFYHPRVDWNRSKYGSRASRNQTDGNTGWRGTAPQVCPLALILDRYRHWLRCRNSGEIQALRHCPRLSRAPDVGRNQRARHLWCEPAESMGSRRTINLDATHLITTTILCSNWCNFCH